MVRKLPFFLALAAMVATSSVVYAAAPVPDAKFLKNALEGDNSEIALGKIAAEKGSLSVTRNFGKTLADDHAKAKEKALDVAKAHGLSDTDATTTAAKAEELKLSLLSGVAFDHEFARYIVQDHQDDIQNFFDKTQHGDKATVELARETLPDLQKHLEMAQNLEQKTGGQ